MITRTLNNTADRRMTIDQLPTKIIEKKDQKETKNIVDMTLCLPGKNAKITD